MSSSIAFGELTLVVNLANLEALVEFLRDVWPLFARDCVACHSVKQRYANLQLDSPARILQGGDIGPAVVPGKPEASTLIARVVSRDPDEVMPPPKSHKARLTAACRQVLASRGM